MRNPTNDEIAKAIVARMVHVGVVKDSDNHDMIAENLAREVLDEKLNLAEHPDAVDNELKAATERQRRHATSGDVYEGVGGQSQHLKDMVTIRDAYLAEHHADDDEHVTEKCLRAIRDRIGRRRLRIVVNGLVVLDIKSFELEWDDSLTRGDVRRLCKALGIELKESD